MFATWSSNPTIDIYFRKPLLDLISRWWVRTPWRPIRRLGPNLFECNGCAILIRYVTPKEFELLSSNSIQRTYYVIDDNFYDLENAASLPEEYRLRLQDFADKWLPQILTLDVTIVSPSQTILNHFEKSGELLQPAYIENSRDLLHFDTETATRAIFPGTRSHINDLKAIASAIEASVENHEAFSLTTFLGKHGPSAIAEHPRIIHRKPQSWRHYRSILKSEQFHMALVPYCDTTFNRARSINKIHDVGAFGAAGLFSDRPPLSDIVHDNENGLLLGDAPRDWTAAIDHLIVNRDEARRLAKAAAQTSARVGDWSLVRKFWLDRLFPEGSIYMPYYQRGRL